MWDAKSKKIIDFLYEYIYFETFLERCPYFYYPFFQNIPNKAQLFHDSTLLMMPSFDSKAELLFFPSDPPVHMLLK